MHKQGEQRKAVKKINKDMTLSKFLYEEYGVEDGEWFRVYRVDDYGRVECFEDRFSNNGGLLFRHSLTRGSILPWQWSENQVDVEFLEKIINKKYLVDMKTLNKEKFNNLQANIKVLDRRVTELENKAWKKYGWQKSLGEGFLSAVIIINIIIFVTWCIL